MTLLQVKYVVLFIIVVVGASSFALWQRSLYAGLWMLMVLLFVELLVSSG